MHHPTTAKQALAGEPSADQARAGLSYQPYYVAYAASRGRTPEEQDRIGGAGYLFIGWIQDRWNEWRELSGERRGPRVTPEQRRRFGAWLRERYQMEPTR